MSEPAPGLASRAAAHALLSVVLQQHKPLDAELSGNPQFAALSGIDRAFAHLMVKTALRRLGQCNALIDSWLEKPLPPKLHNVRYALVLGLTQILFLQVPPHAAVHSTVELMKHLSPAHAALVNALLNRAVREGKEALLAQDEAVLNTPAWLWQRWCETYGESFARGYAIARLEEPPLDIRVKANAESWAEKLGGTLLESGTIRLEGAGNVSELPGYEQGAWWVQDAAAAEPVRVLLAALDDSDYRSKRVLDLCAAPGGKTAQLAATGARVTAVDRSGPRLRTLRANLTRLALPAEVVEADAGTWKPSLTPDAILLDAPCSATGTLRRHPDVAWHRSPEDIARLASAQSRLLTHALSLLPPKGILAYSVCSVQPEEGKEQIARLCAAQPGIKVLTEIAPFASFPDFSADGFYIAVLKKG